MAGCMVCCFLAYLGFSIQKKSLTQEFYVWIFKTHARESDGVVLGAE